MINASTHTAVMLKEVLVNLQAQNPGSYLDCTLGGAGHTCAILESNTGNTVTAIDRDKNAVQRAKLACDSYQGRLIVSHLAFSQLKDAFAGQKFSGILADLGLSSDQLAESRGFSFKDSGALDMRMNPDQSLSAASVVNEYEYNELYRSLKCGGVGKYAKAITSAIIRARPINDTKELVQCIHKVCGATEKGDQNKDSATVVFQAIRMEVNQELAEIEALLDYVESVATPGARFVVISFHSLEDTLVTRRMRAWGKGPEFSALWPASVNKASENTQQLGRLLTKKAIFPNSTEVQQNPRARSARMRVFEFN